MSIKYAPIVLFAYNRPKHIRHTLEALLKNSLSKESDLVIYSDAAKSETQEEKVREVREYIHQVDGFNSIKIIERESNLGLARSVIEGVTSVVNEYGRVIVLEDDLATSPYFLEYMNLALEKYAKNDQVMQISGYMFPVDTVTEGSVLFLPFTTSWGWATWQHAWNHFDPTARGYEELKNNRIKRKAFDLDGSFPYFKMLESQIRGEIDSWAIQWWLTVFLRNGLVLYPRQSLVENIGFDGSGRHCGNENFAYIGALQSEKIDFHNKIELSIQNYENVTRYLKNANSRSITYWIRRIFRWGG